MTGVAVPASLAAFFELAGPFLVRGEGDAESVERALGSSPSGTARLALYATLVERQQLEALDALFPATRRALDHGQPGGFRRLTRRFASTHRSALPHPGGLGAELPDFLAREAYDPWAGELADYERVRYLLASAAEEDAGASFATGYSLRRYRFAVHATSDEAPVPAQHATNLLLVREPTTWRVRWLTLGAADLVAIGIVVGTYERAAAASFGVADEALERAWMRLRGVGWLRTA